MQACGDVMIGQHGCTGDQCMKLSRIFVGQRRFPLLFFYHHHLEIINQSIKPTVERLSYILHDSSISRDPHLLTICVSFKHYFKDDELDTFKSAMSTIQQNNDPTNAPFNFVINCTPSGDVAEKCNEGKGS